MQQLEPTDTALQAAPPAISHWLRAESLGEELRNSHADPVRESEEKITIYFSKARWLTVRVSKQASTIYGPT